MGKVINIKDYDKKQKDILLLNKTASIKNFGINNKNHLEKTNFTENGIKMYDEKGIMTKEFKKFLYDKILSR